MLSAFSVERCPPSRWNTVRHQHGIVSAIAWNTHHEQLEQATILMQDSGIKPTTAYADLGYRGVEADIADVRLVHRGKIKRLTQQERKLLKRRQAIEPVIGHLKQDHRMDRCHLKGEQGDRLHAVLCAAGYNIRWLLRMIAKKGVPFLKRAFLCLIAAVGLIGRSKRYALYAEDGVVKVLHLEENPGVCETSGGEALLAAI